MAKELSLAEIAELQQEGYSVHEVVDLDPIRYRWSHCSGASQIDAKDRQPYRKSKAQAWVDCRTISSATTTGHRKGIGWISNRKKYGS
ncbi:MULTISPECIES: hypothetical protein [Burkholderiaceae]|jgi:hypothetical protein|uniref:hypothetical protein n=1 Tax=Burkholderiaceae TaxID=119060 RepID=UPI0011B22392|nr:MULTISPECIES: hypothetical protein [Burkholderiaceae]USX10670.1 hypothetical protein NHH62_29100 [Paraburkholderia fungorum]